MAGTPGNGALYGRNVIQAADGLLGFTWPRLPRASGGGNLTDGLVGSDLRKAPQDTVELGLQCYASSPDQPFG